MATGIALIYVPSNRSDQVLSVAFYESSNYYVCTAYVISISKPSSAATTATAFSQ